MLHFIPIKEEYVAVFRGSCSGLGRAFTIGCWPILFTIGQPECYRWCFSCNYDMGIE